MNGKIRNITLIAIFIVLTVCTIISISYAYYVITSPGDTYELSTTMDIPACIDINIQDEGVMTLDGDYAIPVMDSRLLNSDEQVLNNYKYTFTISNGCTNASNVVVSLAPLLESTMPIDAVKYALVEEGKLLPKSGNYVMYNNNQRLLTNQTINDIKLQQNYDVKTGYEILNTSLGAMQSKKYNLYLWIDYYEGDRSGGMSKNNTTTDKTFSSIVVISDYIKGLSGGKSLLTLQVGDEYCFGDECFYTISNDNKGTIKLLAKYNLYIGYNYSDMDTYTIIDKTDSLYGKQHSLAIGTPEDDSFPRYGTIAYNEDRNDNSYANSIVKPYVDEYGEYLSNLSGIELTSSLITKEELLSLGCNQKNDGNYTCVNADYDWVYSTTYWTVSPGTQNSQIFVVGADGFMGASGGYTSHTRGIRPVITISLDELNSNVTTEEYPLSWNDNGVFSDYYALAYEKLNTMSTSEKVGQLLIMSYSNDTPSTANDAVLNYHVGGVLFFANAFTGKTEAQVKTMISGLQAKAKIPLMTAVDEEGGTVVRVSSNTNLASARFKSPQDLYAINGFNTIREDTITKSALLKKLGLNVNFAPVVDIADPGNFIYKRTLGQGPQETATYARTVIEASKGGGVSYSLKHFPGYGNNADTHTSSSVDETSLEELWNKHLVPFIAGIDSGAEAVMVSHNIVSALDKDYPSSLSKPVHDLLFNDLKFTGIVFTDDLVMDAIGNNYSQQYLKAFKAGNHILLTSSSYATAHGEILKAVNSGEISMEDLNKRVFKVLAWKYYMGLLEK